MSISFEVPEARIGDAARIGGAKRATRAAVFGTFIEYYDFSVYGYVAATLAVVFFPSDDPTIGLLNTLLVFGSAFLVRPFGALIFGWLGDRFGRRTSLIASITLMGLAATLIGLLPGYAQIGVWAPILLVLLRMLQGVSAGGEIGGAASYIREWAAPDKRSLYISFLPSIGNVAKAAAAGIAGLIAAQLSGPDLVAWGWRIPFLLALPLGLYGLYLRLQIADSPEFEAVQKAKRDERSPVGAIAKEHPLALLKVTLIALVQNVGTYVGTVFVAVYFSTVVGFTKSEASTIVLFAVLFAAVLIPVAGSLGNKIGARKLLFAAYVAYMIISIPSFALMQHGSAALAFFGLALGMVPYALCQAGTYSIMPEFFPVRVRHTGVAFGHSVGAVIGGGISPPLATWLISMTGDKLVPAFLLAGSGALGFVLLLTVRSRRNGNSTDEHGYE